MPTKAFDYVVIGGGSAGCTAASRLVGEFGARVLLLEAGGDYKDWILKVPAGFSKILGGTKYLTQHHTVPQEQLGGRVQIIPQGRVLGGGSSVNAQAYMRGRAADYDVWGNSRRPICGHGKSSSRISRGSRPTRSSPIASTASAGPCGSPIPASFAR